jgi:single-stranded-DNA-specific exonuclease
LHIAGKLEIDDWGGRRKPKLRIDDASAPTGPAA